ncbi:MAG: DUF1461 domain-containing protein [Firmicutes bacterium]|nr:DUF1461 domain-containing protein [Bacillota bacterium]
MNKKGMALYALLIILLPLAVIILSGNGVLRASLSYSYHFNDIQASNLVDSSLNNTELAEEITGYFNSFGDEEFQIYEQNGEFMDPAFDNLEVMAMKRAKQLLKWTLIAGGIFFVMFVAVYIYLALRGEKRYLRISGIAAVVSTIIALIVKCVLISNDSFRDNLYERFINIALNEEATLRLILGSPMEIVYLVFSSILTIAVTLIFLYIHIGVTREKGMFKRS